MKRNWALWLVILFAVVANAQTTLRHYSTNSAVASSLPPTINAPSASVEVIPVTPSSIPRLSERRAADKKFWMVNAYDALWTVVDIETTVANLKSDPSCQEKNPLVGTRPSRTVLYLSNLPVMAGAAYLSYRSHKKQGKFWYLLPSLSGSAHAAGAVWNMTGSSCR